MLPDFPELKKEIKQNFENYIRKQSRLNPLQASITQVFVHEGDKLVYHTVDGNKNEVSFKKIESKFNLSNEKIIRHGPQALIPIAQEAASDIQKQLGRNIISKFSETAEKTGNKIEAKGAEISSDLILQALEKIPIDFDDEGNPCLPVMVVPPELEKQLQKKIPEWEKDTDYQKKREILMKKKKEEWDDKESHRKLVD